MKRKEDNLIDMNRDNISALIMAIAVVSLIAGFAIYFNSPSLNKASSEQPVERICPIFIFITRKSTEYQ
jgi:Kef-type K+ transport system membrane component KefB